MVVNIYMLERMLFTYIIVGRGGDAVQVNALAEGFENSGCQVVLSGPFPVKPYEFGSTEGNLRNIARRLPWWLKDLLETGLAFVTIRRGNNYIAKIKFDVIFHRAGIYDFTGCYLKKKSALPLIIHLDAPYKTEREYKGESYFKFLHKVAMRNIGRCADLVVTMSVLAKEYYIKLGIPEKKILVFPNGISEREMKKGIALAGEYQPFSDDGRIVIGFLGSLSRWHRVDLLLDAFKLLLEKQMGKYYLIIIGKGEEYEKLREKTENLGISDYVEWTGPLTPDRAFEEIARFDIAVLPHTLTTGAPIKLFEYAALARPVVAPDLPNIRSLFYKDTEICLFKPESVADLAMAIENIANNRDLFLSIGLNMQRRVRDYTWENIVKSMLKAVTL